MLDCLCARFPAIDRDTWLARMQRAGCWTPRACAGPQARIAKACVHLLPRVAGGGADPFEARILYRDEHLLVADKPHFLPVMPAGGYVEQTLLARLARSTGNRDLVPLHRIDRHTAGLVLFSTNPGSRGRYQALFRERRIDKYYEAIAPALPRLDSPLLRRTRLVPGEPFFRMREGEGEPNSETRIEVVERNGRWWRYRLYPVTGKKHQLRVHSRHSARVSRTTGSIRAAGRRGQPRRLPAAAQAAGPGAALRRPAERGEAYVRIRAAARLAGVGDRLASGMLAYVADPERMARFMSRRSAWRAARASRRIARCVSWTRLPERARCAQDAESSLDHQAQLLDATGGSARSACRTRRC